MTEKQIQHAILREFGTRSDMRLWRANTGVARFAGPTLGQTRVVAFGVPGQADLTGILPGGVRLEVEVKTLEGNQLDDQRNFQRMVERFGGIYVLARSVQDVWDAIAPYLARCYPSASGASPSRAGPAPS